MLIHPFLPRLACPVPQTDPTTVQTLRVFFISTSVSTCLQQSYVNSLATAQGLLLEPDYPIAAPNQMEVWNKSLVISFTLRVGTWPLWPNLRVRFNASK